MHPDKGYSNFLAIYEKYKDNLGSFNEADTRVKVIDVLLKDCLGWSEDNIKREPKVATGYVDYQLFNMGSCVLVVEAKKAGDYFDIPLTYSSRTYKIDGAISTVRNLIVAMNQARNYCNDLGCKYAAVFNGHQAVLFSPITIGRPWTEGACIVFRSLDDIKDNFFHFWNILAYEHVISGSLSKHLEKGKRDISFEKVIFSIHNPDQSWSRNELYVYIRPISEFVLFWLSVNWTFNRFELHYSTGGKVHEEKETPQLHARRKGLDSQTSFDRRSRRFCLVRRIPSPAQGFLRLAEAVV